MFRHLWSKKLSNASLVPLLVLLVACQQPPKAGPSPGATKVVEFVPPGLEILVDQGESSQAVYSPKGDKLLFVSRKRETHALDQIYEKDLASRAERRITFQNGNTSRPQYHPKDGSIVYSSSTDELKEKAPTRQTDTVVSKLPEAYLEPAELYLHSLRGLEISRLTEHPGFDGEPRFASDGNSITFTRANASRTQVLSIPRTGGRNTHEIKGLGVNPVQYVVSPDGKSKAWIEWDESFGVAHLRLLLPKAKQPIELNSEMIVTKTDLSFTSDSKYLLWSQADATNPVADIWAVSLTPASDGAALCPQRLTTSTADRRRDPVVSPDQQWLTFTLLSANRSRIARMSFTAPSGPCPTTP